MLKKYWLYILAAGLTACSTNSKVNNNSIVASDYNSPIYNSYQGSVIFSGINDYWQFTKREDIDGTEVNVYVPYTETEGIWSEKIEISHEQVKPETTVYKYYSQIIFPEINDQCYFESPHFRIIQQTANDLTFTYTMKNCGKNADQTVVSRILRAPNSISAINYAVKSNSVIPPQEEQMIALVNTARIIKD